MLSTLSALALLPLFASAVADLEPATLTERATAATTYNCPTGQTIDTAYYNYCPSSPGQSLSLQGIQTLVTYKNSIAGDYQTTSSSDFQLMCDYGLPSRCSYAGGGGSSLSGNANNDNRCPVLSAAVAQQSGGGQLRRRDVVDGVTPKFTCPRGATDNTAFSSVSTIYGGSSVVPQAATVPHIEQGVEAGKVLYGCQITTPQNLNSVICYYSQANADSESAVFFGYDNTGGADPSVCPQTLCQAVDDGQYVMPKRRRSLAEQATVDAIQARQVNTEVLRLRAGGKGRSRQRVAGSRWSTGS